MNKRTLIILACVIGGLAAIDVGARIFFKLPAESQAVVQIGAAENADAVPLVGNDRDAQGCIGSAGYSWCEVKRKCLRPWEEPCGIAAKFVCAQKKTIDADFENAPQNQVTLTLSDGRLIILPHARSADGARYANADESFVFWNKGDTAFIQEQGQETYSDCLTKS